MSIVKGIAPRAPFPLGVAGFTIPKLVNAVEINVSAGGSLVQDGDDIAYVINSGAGPTQRDGIWASWELDDVLGNRVDRHSDGLGIWLWAQRIASIVDPGLSDDVDISCYIGTNPDINAATAEMGGGVRFSAATATPFSSTLEGAATNLVADGTPTGTTRQAYISFYELLANFPGLVPVFGLSLAGVGSGDLASLSFNQATMVGKLYFSIVVNRSDVLAAGNISGKLRAMHAALGPLARNYEVIA